ncbi:gp528 [Bacillus phage G]|uniref:Gp528 n=1 Tax=Bacillus phage G TaxID=2884420 RepID=G3MAR9_9CAUD|nr:gp528 [Bacillus phage G]AEO93786.1 gp528 [Bacillus phage G]
MRTPEELADKLELLSTTILDGYELNKSEVSKLLKEASETLRDLSSSTKTK